MRRSAFIVVTVASSELKHIVPVHDIKDVAQREDGKSVLTFELRDGLTKNLIVKEPFSSFEQALGARRLGA